jgi:tetratricopeptide (TPR) repeat protein
MNASHSRAILGRCVLKRHASRRSSSIALAASSHRLDRKEKKEAYSAKPRIFFVDKESYRQRSLQASLFSTSNKPAFDPFSASSSKILKQADEELSPEELALKRALESYPDDTYGVLDDLQHAYMDLGYWQEALGIERTKCQDYLPDTDEYADSIHAQGKLFLRQQDFRNAQKLYAQALEYFTVTNNSVQRGHVLISMAGWHYFRNRLDDSLELLCESESLLDTNPTLLVKCLDNQGLIHRLWGDYETALDKYRQALQVVVDEETRQALTLHVADMLSALEEMDQALQVYRELFESTQNQGMQGVLLHNIAMIHVDQGDYDMAVEEFNLALDVKRQTGGENNPEVAKTLNALGALYGGILDQKTQAMDYFRQALMIARINADDKEDDPDVLHALRNLTALEKEIKR